ncbi:hypothetical protein LCGC14_2691780 [marine sediment metagenome]|uniref:Uncharacterized protein n=1 Tax=marine sediment metagenome TaxID=412755 RepID=A0A0F9A5T2_9ZZZZ
MKTKQEKPRCSTRVSDSTGWHTYQCMKNATILRDGNDHTHEGGNVRHEHEGGNEWHGHEGSNPAYKESRISVDPTRTEITKMTKVDDGYEPLDGKWFCKTHDPVAKAERQSKRYEDRNASYAALKARHDRVKADFVARITEAAQMGGCDDRREAVAAIVEEIVGTGMSWGRR